MTVPQFDDLVEYHLEEIAKLSKTKGTDYTNGSDRLSNFKENGAQLGLSPTQVWGVYASKHWNAIQAYVRNGQVESEPIEGRIHDLILYLFLLLGIIEDQKVQTEPKKPKSHNFKLVLAPKDEELFFAGDRPKFYEELDEELDESTLPLDQEEE